ncbi:unnamed protein product, partial [Hapterophycus canaliculatus]
MLPVRLLALTVCSYLTPAIRKPLRPQPHRSCYHNWRPLSLSTDRERQRTAAPSAIRSLQLSTMSSSASTASSPGEGVTADTNPPSGSSSGSGRKGPDALPLDTAAGVYRYLRGRWDLEKTIDYKAGGMAGTWQGVATFSPQQKSLESSNESAAPQEETDTKDGIHSSSDSADLLLLRYLEQGTFRVNGKGAGFEAGQRLVYDCSGHVVRVHFVDDPKKPDSLRFFHQLDFRTASEPSVDTTATAGAGGGAETSGKASMPGEKKSASPRAEFEHLCVRDMYRGQVEVVGPNEFKTRWHVTGPQKDGRIHSTFKR